MNNMITLHRFRTSAKPIATAVAMSLFPRGEGEVLKAVYEKEEDIPEVYAPLFSERDGKWELTKVQGIRTPEDIARLDASLKKERTDHKETKTTLAEYKKLGDVEELTEKIDKYPELEAAAASGDDNETKVTEMADARVAALMKPVQRELDELKTANTEQGDKITGFETSDRKRKIKDEIVKVFSNAKGFEAGAMDDAVLLGSSVLEITEDGLIQTKEGTGYPEGLSAALWLEEVTPNKPHWFGASAGSGALGADGKKNVTGNPFSRENFNVTKQGQMEQANPEKALRYAKAAGYNSLEDVPAKPPAAAA